MRRFLVGFLAVFGFLSLVFLVAAGGGVYWLVTNFQDRRETLPEEIVLRMDLRGGLEEGQSADPFDVLGFGSGMTVIETVEALDKARGDTRVKGLMAIVDGGNNGLAVTQELRQAVQRFRESGKPTIAFAHSFGELSPGNTGYYLATAFNEIHLQPVGLVGLTGFAIEQPFLKDTLDELGIEFDIERRAEYKTAAEFLTESEPTQANAAMTMALLDSLEGQMVRDIAKSRDIDEARIASIIAGGPYTSAEALERRLIDQIGYRDQAEEALKSESGNDGAWLDIAAYADLYEADLDDPAVVASIVATGMIVGGESDLGQQIGADTTASAIRDAAENEDVEAILLRLDSPGGSAVASETIGREIERAVADGTPVIVSMSDSAASGGYWIAMKSSHIVAEPATLTGSIGVIGGKPVLAELWNKIDVNWATFARNDHATIWSVNQDYSTSEAERIDALIDAIYADFRNGVAEGRNLDPAEVERIAKGRVWTGEQALERGLVDELGGYFEAQAAVRDLAGLDADVPLEMRPFPEPDDPLDRALALFRGEFRRLGVMGMIEAMWQARPWEIGSLPTAHVLLPEAR